MTVEDTQRGRKLLRRPGYRYRRLTARSQDDKVRAGFIGGGVNPTTGGACGNHQTCVLDLDLRKNGGALKLMEDEEPASIPVLK